MFAGYSLCFCFGVITVRIPPEAVFVYISVEKKDAAITVSFQQARLVKKQKRGKKKEMLFTKRQSFITAALGRSCRRLGQFLQNSIIRIKIYKQEFTKAYN